MNRTMNAKQTNKTTKTSVIASKEAGRLPALIPEIKRAIAIKNNVKKTNENVNECARM